MPPTPTMRASREPSHVGALELARDVVAQARRAASGSAGPSPARKRSVMRTAPSRQESVSAAAPALDADELHRAAAEVEHGAVAQRRRVDRRQVAGARLLLAREDADREPRRRARALEEVLGVRGLADRARRDGVDLAGARPEAAQKWAKTSIAAEARAIASSPSSPGLLLAGADAHRLVDLVGALPPAGEPVRARRVDAEDDEPERVRAEVGDREPRELGAGRRVRPGRRGGRRRVSRHAR